MNALPSTAFEDYQALLRQLDSLSQYRRKTTESFSEFRDAVSGLFANFSGPTNEVHSDFFLRSMEKLALHANDALSEEQDYFEQLILALADATRSTSTWRILFGSVSRRSKHLHGSASQSSEADCVLDVARRALTLKFRVSSAAITSSLKVVANCCADQNSNRELIIHRNGIEVLLQLSQLDANMDAVIATLYNVCVDYDEPATFSGPLSDSLRNINEADEKIEDGSDGDVGLSLSVERLAEAYSSDNNFTTFKLLLSRNSEVTDPFKPYLSELVEMATLPASVAFEHICLDKSKPWSWNINIQGKAYDTIELVVALGRQGTECLLHVSRAMLNILAHKEVVDALKQREDQSIWTLLTLPCLHSDLENDDETSAEALSVAQKEFLKILYQITGDSSFYENGNKASALLETSICELESCIVTDQDGHKHWHQHTPSGGPSILLASACVVLSQLAASDTVREAMFSEHRLMSCLTILLESEESPDVLYPAITIISRIALASHADLALVHYGILSNMQRLLTAKGLGLTVPFETVVAYRNSLRGRPALIDLLLEQGRDDRTILEDILKLWTLSMEARTKLEIGKFFLEFLRTALSETARVVGEGAVATEREMQTQLGTFLSNSSSQVAGAFAWVCIKAEPPPQQDHGWFALAMLSTWPEGRPGIYNVIDQQDEIRNAILATSQLVGGPAANNLKVMISKLNESSAELECSDTSRDALRTAGQNLGLGPMF